MDNPLKLLQQARSYRDAGRLEESIAAYRCAIAAGGPLPDALCNLGEALNEADRPAEAVDVLRQAIAIAPRMAFAYVNLTLAMFRLGQLDEAIRLINWLIGMEPMSAQAHLYLGLLLMKRGDWAQGWDEMEWRWRLPWVQAFDQKIISIPSWNGQPLNGQKIMLHGEQGFGDAIQFVRYVPFVAQQGGHVVLRCSQQLEGLFQSVPGVDQIVVGKEELPAVQCRCSVMSLPRVFETRPHNVPVPIPYLRPPDGLIEQWKAHLGDAGGRLRIGLFWSGRLGRILLNQREVPIELLAPLATIKNIELHSLSIQPGEGESLKLIDHAEQLTDFAQTAALMSQLDLVITIDSAVAHLAGALGRPVWMFTPFACDWRWAVDGERCAWYPTMRLFRRALNETWEAVVERVAEALRKTAANPLATDYFQ